MHTEHKSSCDEAKCWHAKEETENYESHVIRRKWDGHCKNNHQYGAADAHHLPTIPEEITYKKIL